MWRNDGKNYFRSIKDLASTEVADGSEKRLASVAETAAGKVNGRKSSYALADEIAADAMEALTLLRAMTGHGNVRTDVLIKSLEQQTFLGLYFAHKIRGATQLKAGLNNEARDTMGKAYGWWMLYTNAMNDLYLPGQFRTYDLSEIGWHFYDAANLKEFHDLGGVGAPELPKLPTAMTPKE